MWLFISLFILLVVWIIFNLISERIESTRKTLEQKLNRCEYENKQLGEEIQRINESSIKTKDEFNLTKSNLILKIENDKKEIIQKSYSIQEIQKEIQELKNKNNHLIEGYEFKDNLIKDLKSNPKEFISRIASLYSDFLLVQFDISAKYLQTKKNPAEVEALRIKDLKIEAKAYVEQYRQMLYRYEALFQLFPELSNYVEDIDEIKKLEDVNSVKNLQENFDRVQNYISKEEYQKLNVNQRNQLALDRYVKNQKSTWQIGRDYELFSGIEYEKKGWKVSFYGIEKKLEDMGRDLIAVKGNEHHVIQCKYWSKDKVIREKHITQLFGTTIEYSMDFSNDIKILPVLITNISLSDKAYEFAYRLGVLVKDNTPLENFPRIKCNINKDEYGIESKIYHLPFDQQYDRTKIDKNGEFFAYTVEEAVKNGFRRAFKYHG